MQLDRIGAAKSWGDHYDFCPVARCDSVIIPINYGFQPAIP